MNIVIIEDEQKSAIDLAKQLKKLDSSINILTILDSIEKSVEWINTNPLPDLIFMDIQLGDGNSLSIFSLVEINCPVIFCTAYDEYAIDAFKLNGIGYIVKPINNQMLKEALNKYKLLGNHYTTASKSITTLALALSHHISCYKSSYLVNYKTKMIPIPSGEIAFFYVNDGNTYLVTNNNEFLLPKNMETIENEIDPNLFYRVNRQYIVSYKHIKEIEHYGGRKIEIIMKVPVKETILVSKEKATEFKNWMENR